MQQKTINTNTEIRLNTNTRPRPTGTPSNLEGEFLENTTHSTAASGTSPNLREEFIDSPSKLEGVARSARGVCQNADTLHSQQADSSPNLVEQL